MLEDQLLAEFAESLRGQAADALGEEEQELPLAPHAALAKVMLGYLEEAGAISDEFELAPHEDAGMKRPCRCIGLALGEDSTRLELFTAHALNQSAIVSMVLEALFAHRSTLSGVIPPFQAVIEEAHNFIPSRSEGTDETPSLPTIRKVITEGRKFGTGLVLISQRPSRLDETTLAQCNSFLVLRLVNPNDKRFVRSVMENLSEQDANILQTFGPGQGIVSGQAVRFPLLVKVKFDEDLVSEAIGDEDFIAEAGRWKPDARRKAIAESIARNLGGERPAGSTGSAGASGTKAGGGSAGAQAKKKPGRRGRGGLKPKF